MLILTVLPQISRFLWDHGDVAFAPLGKLMLENFKLEGMRVSEPFPLSREGGLSSLGSESDQSVLAEPL